MNVGSKTNLFPLSHVNTGLHGYFIDVVGAVWSTRKKSEPQKLAVRNGVVQLTYLGGNARSVSTVFFRMLEPRRRGRPRPVL